MRRLGLCLGWTIFALGVGVAACAEETDAPLAPPPDASDTSDAFEASAPSPDGGSVVDAGDAGDGESTPLPDTKPREVTCATTPCVLQLSRMEGTRPILAGFCALLDDGTVACWGSNQDGGLGRGTTSRKQPFSAVVQRVTGLTHAKSLEKTCAIDDGGVAWCWGTGPFLQSTTSASTTQTTPVQLPIPAFVKRLGYAYDPTVSVGCADVDTGFYCWGTNTYGHLGPQPLGTNASEVHGLQEIALPAGASMAKLKVSHAAFVLRDDGSVLSWGNRIAIGRPSSLNPDPEPYPLDLAPVSALDSIENDGCAISRGVGYCWGTPLDGSTGMESSRALPRAIEMPEPIVDISTPKIMSANEESFRVCAIGASGAVYCLGSNDDGQAGGPSFAEAVHPVAVQGLPAPAVTLEITPKTSCALLTTGQVFCWGNDSTGGLGQGEPVDSTPTPLEVKLP